MIYYTMCRGNGDVAFVRDIGFKYCADVRTRTGHNDNANWNEEFTTIRECKAHLEKYGFKAVIR